MLAPPTIFARERARRARRAGASPRAAAAPRSTETSPVRSVARHRVARQQHVRQAADLRRRVVQHDRHARPEADRRDRPGRGDRVVSDLDARCRTRIVLHRRRKMRSRASTGAKSARARAEQRLDFAEHEKPARRERRVKRVEQRLLRLAVEVDDDVAADDQVEAAGGGRRSDSRSRRSKSHERPDGRRDRERRRGAEKYRARSSSGVSAKSRFVELAALRGVETCAVDVGSEDAHARQLREHAVRGRRSDGRAPRASTALRPTSTRRSRRGSTDVSRARARERPCAASASYASQLRKSFVTLIVSASSSRSYSRRIAVEHARVVGVRVHAARAHAHRDAPAQAFLLVARAAEAALARDLARERDEVARVRRRLDHQNTCRTDSRFVRTIALSGIELQRALPAADRLVALLPPQPDVAELEVHVAAELGVRSSPRAGTPRAPRRSAPRGSAGRRDSCAAARGRRPPARRARRSLARVVVVAVALEHRGEIVEQRRRRADARRRPSSRICRRARAVAEQRGGEPRVVEPRRRRRTSCRTADAPRRSAASAPREIAAKQLTTPSDVWTRGSVAPPRRTASSSATRASS